MIRNILFDLDNTLLDFSWAERRALSKTLQQMGVDPVEKILKRYSELNAAQWKLLEKGVITREEVKVRRYMLLFGELGISCSPEEATGIYEKLLKEGYHFMEGAKELLDGLYETYRLYLVTNGTASVQHSRLKSADMNKYFQGIFISEEVGYDKPGRAYFDHCFGQIPDFRKEETILVGDSLTSDVQGGVNAGVATVWFNHTCVENKEGILPDYEIHKLQELPELLKKIEQN